MEATLAGVRYFASWYAFVLLHEAREMWSALPGPWPVKVAICLACLAIPGGFDEIALFAVLRILKARRERRMA